MAHQVGRYRFVDRLAVGGMAEVFVAIAHGSEGFEKPVVIKWLLPQLAAIPRFRQMFLDEARITAQLQHGNIVQVLDMGSMEDRPFLSLEYVDGRDLRTVYHRAQQSGTPLTPPLVAYIASEVCRALDYAHRKKDDHGQPLNIVHRDVNPANIFLSHEGEVKVGDFGLAKARDNLEKSEAGLIKGKFSYMSPEQAAGLEVDHRSDIFSLGTTIYEMTCACLPFACDTDLGVLDRVREATFSRPSHVIARYDMALEKIVLHAMKKDPNARYQTANDMRLDLSRYVQEEHADAGDRELTDFLKELFGGDHRSQSSLIRLPSASALPPTMTSVARADGLSEFARSATPSPMYITPRRFPKPPPIPPEPAPIRQPADATNAPTTRRSAILLVGLTLFVVIAAAAGGILYKHSRRGQASLRITSVPSGARVLLDGKFTGQRTPAQLTDLEVGKDYLVALSHPETLGVEHHFRFHKAGQYNHSFRMATPEEVLSLDSKPSAADVLVDRELRGQTPLALQLPRGKHMITFRKSGFQDKTVYHLARRDRAALSIHLEREAPPPSEPQTRPKRKPTDKPQPRSRPIGVIEVVSETRAKVYLNGRYVGRTPGFRASVPAGLYAITVKPEDSHIVHKAQVEVVAKKTHRLRLTPPQ